MLFYIGFKFSMALRTLFFEYLIWVMKVSEKVISYCVISWSFADSFCLLVYLNCDVLWLCWR